MGLNDSDVAQQWLTVQLLDEHPRLFIMHFWATTIRESWRST